MIKLKRRNIFLAAVIALAANSIVKAETVRNCNAAANIPEQGVQINMIQGSQKHRYAKAIINGVSARAVLDTAGMGIGGLISEQLLERMNLAKDEISDITANGAHGSSNAKRITMETTALGNASVDNLMFMTTKEAVMKGDEAPVLIGSRFLCQFLVEFDFQNNILSLYNAKTPFTHLIKDKRQWVENKFENFYGTGGIIFPMQLNGKSVQAALDTGSPYTGVNWKASELAGIDKNSDELVHYEALPHSLNATENTIVNEASFNLSLENNQLNRTDNAIRINDIHAFKQLFGDNPGMILGLPFMEKRRLIIDYANGLLYFTAQKKDEIHTVALHQKSR